MKRKILLIALMCCGIYAMAQQKKKNAHGKSFRVIVLFENGGHHLEFTNAAQPWLNELAKQKNFTIDYITKTDTIDETFLKNCRLFIQLDYVPYGWKEKAQKAFIKYIEEGWGGWIGLHHASLLGDFDGYKMWPWFSHFLGNIEYTNYIATFAKATVHIEDRSHPVVKNLPEKFTIEKEEWYTYNKSPRPNVHVVASVDENSYQPDSDKKMGDHPVIWSNPKMHAKNVYIFMGHSPDLFLNPAFTTILSNAVSWASH
ncbi:MAG: ThuA domain-containing protein [Agriterribacter sp.]